jgi:hypothetical protein
MRILSASLIMLALIATEPAFAGCGSHGVYRSRSAKASIVVKKVVKREAPRGVFTAAATLADKPKPTVQASVSNATVAEALPAKSVESGSAKRCEEYSATIGAMINVPCS